MEIIPGTDIGTRGGLQLRKRLGDQNYIIRVFIHQYRGSGPTTPKDVEEALSWLERLEMYGTSFINESGRK